MTDLESEEVMEGPRVSSAFEFGGTAEKPRTRGKFWFRAIATESAPDEGLIMHIARRPRTKKGMDPHPTVRVMRPNPAGMLYAKIKSGDIIVETQKEFTDRMRLMEEAGEDIGEVQEAGGK